MADIELILQNGAKGSNGARIIKIPAKDATMRLIAVIALMILAGRQPAMAEELLLDFEAAGEAQRTEMMRSVHRTCDALADEDHQKICREVASKLSNCLWEQEKAIAQCKTDARRGYAPIKEEFDRQKAAAARRAAEEAERRRQDAEKAAAVARGDEGTTPAEAREQLTRNADALWEREIQAANTTRFAAVVDSEEFLPSLMKQLALNFAAQQCVLIAGKRLSSSAGAQLYRWCWDEAAAGEFAAATSAFQISLQDCVNESREQKDKLEISRFVSPNLDHCEIKARAAYVEGWQQTPEEKAVQERLMKIGYPEEKE